METIYLQGAEDVRRAGSQIADAAALMHLVQGWFREAMETHAQAMREVFEQHERVMREILGKEHDALAALAQRRHRRPRSSNPG